MENVWVGQPQVDQNTPDKVPSKHKVKSDPEVENGVQIVSCSINSIDGRFRQRILTVFARRAPGPNK